MKNRTSTEAIESNAAGYDTLEQGARENIQAQQAHLLAEEMSTFLGRLRHERRRTVIPVDLSVGSRSGYGKLRQLSMMNGTVTVLYPKVRDHAERFEGKIFPLFT